METDAANRYRSRILREMNANRENPFNSPPSSTGSHGTISPTLSSVFSDPDGESTRKLNEDIARVTAPRKLPVNWDVAHRKWPEFFSKPKSRDLPIFDDDTETRPLSSQSKENRPPHAAVKFADDSTQDPWAGSTRTRAEMQPHVDNDSDASSLLGKSPGRGLSVHARHKSTRHPSPLVKSHTRASSPPAAQTQRLPSIADALDELRRTSLSPKNGDRRGQAQGHGSPHFSSAKSSLTAVPPSPESIAEAEHNASNVRSFFMPDVSHLGDFVTGTLRFSGSMRNGVPIFVKNGRVHDRQEKPYVAATHAEVEGFDIPQDEEKIFVSMDMIRDEIISLQEHHDKVQEYAEKLQQQVETLESQLKTRKYYDGGANFDYADEQLVSRKNQLEVEVAKLQSRLERASQTISTSEIENESLAHERDRAVSRLQDACDDINKLTRKLSYKEKELESSPKQGSSTELHQDNDTLRRDIITLKHGRDALELENSSLRNENEKLQRDLSTRPADAEPLHSDNDGLRRNNESLISENRSLRSKNQTLMEEDEDLRENLDGVQHELDAVREEVESLRQEAQTVGEEKSTLQEDNDSLVRHNEKYFTENKILRRENSGFERSVHDLHDENAKLKDEIEFLKQQLDHCRPIPKDDFSARLDEETEENMTSAFFVPDITINTNDSAPAEHTETKEMPAPPEFTIAEDQTEQDTRNTNKRENQQRSRSKSRGSLSKSAHPNQKVAFAIPEKNSRASNMANKGSKRRTAAQRDDSKRSSLPNLDFLDYDDTTGQSLDITQERSLPLSVSVKDFKENTANSQRQSRSQMKTAQSQKSQRTRSLSRSSQKHATGTVLTDVTKTTNQEVCPALSNNARRILDNLCDHNCRNCIVCTRITSHRGVISSKDMAAGKKRVTVQRPIPVSDRNLSVEDPTMRPSQSPAHALALVIKGLTDEANHLELEISQRLSEYHSKDKAHGHRESLALRKIIRTLEDRRDVKNDQIYALYDVVEGQKAAEQGMSEDEVELTVLSITGMSLRDVTSMSDQFTWEGIQEA